MKSKTQTKERKQPDSTELMRRIDARIRYGLNIIKLKNILYDFKALQSMIDARLRYGLKLVEPRVGATQRLNRKVQP